MVKAKLEAKVKTSSAVQSKTAGCGYRLGVVNGKQLQVGKGEWGVRMGQEWERAVGDALQLSGGDGE